MANTGEIQVNVAVLDDGGTAVTANASKTATTTFTPCTEGILTIQCFAVSSSGIMVPTVWGSSDAGVSYAALTPTTGSAAAAVSATGVTNYRYKSLPGKLQLRWVKTSGTSITATVVMTGLVPLDSANATAV